MRDALKGFFALRPRPLRRTVQLAGGLAILSLGVAVQVKSRLGLAPWDVLHQGLARAWGLSLGTMVILVSLAVLVL